MEDGNSHDEADEDPAIARVRRELARLGSDESSAPPVPEAVTARIDAALRGRPAHSIARPRLRRWPIAGLVVGVGAAVIGVVVGTSALSREPVSRLPTGPTASTITVRPEKVFPVSAPDVVALLAAAPDYGPLTDPAQRAGCLDGLGHAQATAVLGARPVTIDGEPRVLLLLPGATADTVVALIVEPNCSQAHPGLVADTVVRRP